VNILDISQTVVQDFFNMMMVVDVSASAVPFADLGAGLSRLGSGMGLEIRCQKAAIFEKMHRI
jgi:ACT domain-containing protein